MYNVERNGKENRRSRRYETCSNHSGPFSGLSHPSGMRWYVYTHTHTYTIAPLPPALLPLTHHRCSTGEHGDFTRLVSNLFHLANHEELAATVLTLRGPSSLWKNHVLRATIGNLMNIRREGASSRTCSRTRMFRRHSQQRVLPSSQFIFS